MSKGKKNHDRRKEIRLSIKYGMDKHMSLKNNMLKRGNDMFHTTVNDMNIGMLNHIS